MQIHKGIIVLSLICLIFTNETNSISQTDLFREYCQRGGATSEIAHFPTI